MYMPESETLESVWKPRLLCKTAPHSPNGHCSPVIFDPRLASTNVERNQTLNLLCAAFGNHRRRRFSCKIRLYLRSKHQDMSVWLRITSVAFPLFPVGCSSSSQREKTLRDDLSTLWFEIKQYTVDHQKRPQSLVDLVDAGYLKQLPVDPFTGKRDTWVPEFSAEQENPGVRNVRSGAVEKDKHGVPYNAW